MSLQHWSSESESPRGRVLLIHGLSSLAQSWWRVGPALAGCGWDVTAVDQAGHGGRPLRGEATPAVLADAVRSVYPDAPDVLIGHSLGTVTAFALQPGWARTVILEEPPSTFSSGLCLEIAGSIAADVAAVREDRAAVMERHRRDYPRWAEEDMRWAVEGIAAMDPAPFARRFLTLAQEEQVPVPDRILAVAPEAYVLAGNGAGSVLSRADREELAQRLPAGHVIGIDGGHCLHRDAPDGWLAAVTSIIQ